MIMQFDQRVVIITGAGGGLGRAYALHLASLGASIVVNDLGGSLKGEGASTRAADVVVEEIKAAGGRAVPDYHSVNEAGEAIVEAALKAFGRVDVLINNAGILRDQSMAKMTLDDWDKVLAVHLEGAYKVTKAAWPHMLKQGYGRIISMTSAAGLYGNRGQANYAAAKASLIGLMKTLAIEGDAKGIRCYSVAPLAESRFTQTVLPPEILRSLKPEKIAPVIAWLASEACVSVPNGSVFETAAGWLAAVRWERSKGLVLPSSLVLHSPLAAVAKLKADWAMVEDTTSQSADYPLAAFDVDWKSIASKAQVVAKPVLASATLPLGGKVALVTGGGGGLGRCYCLLLAKLGARVMVNDAGGPIKEKGGRSPAEWVVSEIREAGGVAIANQDSVSTEAGVARMIARTVEVFGRLDILVNNAGILRDRSFLKVELSDWQAVLDVHLKGTFLLAKAAWPIWIQQGSGGWMINTASSVALHGNFGQANYAAAKAGIIGLSQTLALEGHRHHIRVNVVIPYAATSMTARLFPPELAALLKPESVAPLIGALASCPIEQSGHIYEAGGGWFARSRRQRNAGTLWNQSNWEKQAVTFELDQVTYPTDVTSSFNEAMRRTESSLTSTKHNKPPLIPILLPDRHSKDYTTFQYTEYDVILYHLGIGANGPRFVYEHHPLFEPVPSYATVIGLAALNHPAVASWLAQLPSFHSMKLLHGAQKVEYFTKECRPAWRLPTSGLLRTPSTKVVEAINMMPSSSASQKGGAALVTLRNETFSDHHEASPIFANEVSLILRDVQIPAHMIQKRPSSPPNSTPHPNLQGEPDWQIEFETRPDQASLYRLSGDLNPLHIDASVAHLAGFSSPILHGLCTLGMSIHQTLEKLRAEVLRKEEKGILLVRGFGGRFKKHVFPGETLVLEAWHQRAHQRVCFRTRVKDRGDATLAIDQGWLDYSSHQEEATLPLPDRAPSPSSDASEALAEMCHRLGQTLSAISEARQAELSTSLNSRIVVFDIIDMPSPSIIYMDWQEAAHGVAPTLTLTQAPLPKTPDLTVQLKLADMKRLVAGLLSPQDALMKGLVKVKGNLALALKLEPLLSVFRDAATASKL